MGDGTPICKINNHRNKHWEPMLVSVESDDDNSFSCPHAQQRKCSRVYATKNSHNKLNRKQKKMKRRLKSADHFDLEEKIGLWGVQLMFWLRQKSPTVVGWLQIGLRPNSDEKKHFMNRCHIFKQRNVWLCSIMECLQKCGVGLAQWHSDKNPLFAHLGLKMIHIPATLLSFPLHDGVLGKK